MAKQAGKQCNTDILWHCSDTHQILVTEVCSFMRGVQIFFSVDLALTLVTSIENKCVFKSEDADAYFPETPNILKSLLFVLHQ